MIVFIRQLSSNQRPKCFRTIDPNFNDLVWKVPDDSFYAFIHVKVLVEVFGIKTNAPCTIRGNFFFVALTMLNHICHTLFEFIFLKTLFEYLNIAPIRNSPCNFNHRIQWFIWPWIFDQIPYGWCTEFRCLETLAKG